MLLSPVRDTMHSTFSLDVTLEGEVLFYTDSMKTVLILFSPF